MPMRLLCQCTTAVLVAACSLATAQDQVVTQRQQKAISCEVAVKTKHNFLLYLPPAYEDLDKHPLLLFLHGAGERGDNNLNLVKVHGPPKLIAAGKQFPFIVVSPQCRANSWWDATELSGLLDYMEANYKVDPQRIYVTGLSMGGFGTWSLAFRDSQRLAAIAPICGGGNTIAARYTKLITTPTWAFHGAKDRVVPLSRSEELIDILKKNNVDAKLTVYQDAAHDSWTETYNNDELYEWLLQHKREN